MYTGELGFRLAGQERAACFTVCLGSCLREQHTTWVFFLGWLGPLNLVLELERADLGSTPVLPTPACRQYG